MEEIWKTSVNQIQQAQTRSPVETNTFLEETWFLAIKDPEGFFADSQTSSGSDLMAVQQGARGRNLFFCIHGDT
jgi:hypothetical protein